MAIIKKIISIVLIIPALCGLYASDSNDTEALSKELIAQVGYENSLEDAIPQTDLYDMILKHFTSPLPEGKTEKKAIIIGYDGCRADVLAYTKNYFSGITKMLDSGASLKLTYCGGVNYPAVNTQDTSTAPGWCSILTGVWSDKHGVTGNGVTKSLEYKTLLTSLTENGTIDSAAFITSWDGHFETDNATYNLEKAYCEEKGLNVSFRYCLEDTASASAAIKDIKQDDCSDFIFAIYEGTDHAGHSFGFSSSSPIYRAGFRLNDILAYRTINAIKNRDTYETEDWLIILTSDHGGFETGHGGPTIQERMTFVITNK
ncbi:MAG: alkaline phosphatase family protein [Clostridia bacterium]|nr:alkaline phosphatase family protein [Clostridia bacterium]